MERPRFYYDANCRFCRLWVMRWKRTTGEAVEYVPFAVGEKRKSSEFVGTDGIVSAGAEGVFRLLAIPPLAGRATTRGRLLWWYRHVPPFAWASEIAYRAVSSCRVCAYKFMRFLLPHERD